ncbi:prefoldin subunit 1-like [Limulus polyphemus]|uniref:Prefoldin subunit 1-like n=1 Tax=Limulus polyphemus TaxID=6850 RepID=A0ABM1C1M9_LIMPO|nr:prefoldin subunit 1-like [Limulus polyphemus]
MASIPVDLELKKAFQELQTKMVETTQKLKMSDIQIESLKKTIQHAKLTDSEILSLPADTRMYQGLGRTFLLTTPQDIKKDIEEKIKTSDEKIKNLEVTFASVLFTRISFLASYNNWIENSRI